MITPANDSAVLLDDPATPGKKVLVISGTSKNDNIQLQLTAIRGEMPAVKPAREIDLILRDAPREGGPFRIEVVDSIGLKVWNGLADSGPQGVRVQVQQQLTQGDYFVRLYTADGRMLHEYGFRVRT